ncbi:MAG: hypothetical protein FD145_1057 [Candidatus Saganbacteria bacterium]|uniref:NADH:ubiquinone oxidoreductase intermediate-associated protein 30 domain-containing protein n=1 Tax=Candidatus Saganbacteria bacterium TaxID=2575572 RepID=A0A833NZS3_UNCSA|nr:MAG: hypothetical protein FD145_1057 [Candidatus Saganbacteria bacterium]
MKKLFVIFGLLTVFAVSASAVLTFYLVDNFDDGTFSKWFSFDQVKLSIYNNPKNDKKDLVLESCGEYALNISGATKDWYVGGIGTNINVDISNYSRLQIDVLGSQSMGKIKIELYQDSDNSGSIEQDQNLGWKVTKDDIFDIEVPIYKDGYSRSSVPFSAFNLANPGVGSGKWGTGPILRMQLIFVAASQEGAVDCAVDNIIFTN